MGSRGMTANVRIKSEDWFSDDPWLWLIRGCLPKCLHRCDSKLKDLSQGLVLRRSLDVWMCAQVFAYAQM